MNLAVASLPRCCQGGGECARVAKSLCPRGTPFINKALPYRIYSVYLRQSRAKRSGSLVSLSLSSAVFSLLPLIRFDREYESRTNFGRISSNVRSFLPKNLCKIYFDSYRIVSRIPIYLQLSLPRLRIDNLRITNNTITYIIRRRFNTKFSNETKISCS